MSKLNTIEEAIEDIKAGKVIIVVDDEDRENEGDFLCAAESVTPEIINFMATHGRGLICAPLTEDRCDELGLDLMVRSNSDPHETSFTVSVDLIGHGCTTGISAQDRAKTVQALVNPNIDPKELGRPGHIFPLIAKQGGVLRRAGHTEAAIDFARLAGLKPAGCIVEIMNEDGTMARLPDLEVIAEKLDLKLVSIEDLISYRLKHESLIEKQNDSDLPEYLGGFKLHTYKQTTTNEDHLALVKGEWEAGEPIMVRVHSSEMTGDIFGNFRLNCSHQLDEAMELIENEGKGVIIYMNQEGRDIGLINKLKVYKLQQAGYSTSEANEKLGLNSDQRDYGVGAQILRDLNITKLRLLTNNPTKRKGIIGYGLEIVENIPLNRSSNKSVKDYAQTN